MNRISKSLAEHIVTNSATIVASLTAVRSTLAISQPMTAEQCDCILHAYHRAELLNRWLVEALVEGAEVDPIAAAVAGVA